MLTEQQIKAKIKEILADERVSYAAANIFTNAPLAMIQLSMETQVHAYETVLDIPLTNFAKLRKGKKS